MAGYLVEDTRKVTTHRLIEMKQQGKKTLESRPRAVIFFSGDSAADALPAQKAAAALRGEWDVTVAAMPKKLGKALSRYAERGFTAYMVVGQDDVLKELK